MFIVKKYEKSYQFLPIKRYIGYFWSMGTQCWVRVVFRNHGRVDILMPIMQKAPPTVNRGMRIKFSFRTWVRDQMVDQPTENLQTRQRISGEQLI